jgi:hypothetical protein
MVAWTFVYQKGVQVICVVAWIDCPDPRVEEGSAGQPEAIVRTLV